MCNSNSFQLKLSPQKLRIMWGQGRLLTLQCVTCSSLIKISEMFQNNEVLFCTTPSCQSRLCSQSRSGLRDFLWALVRSSTVVGFPLVIPTELRTAVWFSSYDPHCDLNLAWFPWNESCWACLLGQTNVRHSWIYFWLRWKTNWG